MKKLTAVSFLLVASLYSFTASAGPQKLCHYNAAGHVVSCINVSNVSGAYMMELYNQCVDNLGPYEYCSLSGISVGTKDRKPPRGGEFHIPPDEVVGYTGGSGRYIFNPATGETDYVPTWALLNPPEIQFDEGNPEGGLSLTTISIVGDGQIVSLQETPDGGFQGIPIFDLKYTTVDGELSHCYANNETLECLAESTGELTVFTSED